MILTTAILDDWEFFIKKKATPEGYVVRVVVLHGTVYNHPEFSDGMEMNTSPIRQYEESNDIFITYSGQYYKLLTPDRVLRKNFPDPKGLLIKKIYKLRYKTS